MSITSIWKARAQTRNRRRVLEQLRKMVDSGTVEHISVAETKNPLGGGTQFGLSANLCSPVFDAASVLAVRPYDVNSPSLCRNCVAKRHQVPRLVVIKP